MTIYSIRTDFEYKNISGSDEQTIIRFSDYKGQPLKDDWIIPEFTLLEHVTPVYAERRAELKKSIDFDARCEGNIFLVKEKLSHLFTELPAELLPVVIRNRPENFVFINVLNRIEAINFDGLDYKQSMDMMKSEYVRFKRDQIGDLMLFRDIKLVHTYYCTDKFRNIVNQETVTGLMFDKVGEAG